MVSAAEQASLVPGALNFRDVGGLSAGAGATRHGVLFRSGNLSRLESPGVDVLRELGIRRIIDLRDDEEVARAPSVTGQLVIETVRVPLFLGSVESFFANDVSLPELYQGMIDESGERIVRVARAVIEQSPVLVHCMVGKDRTGVSIALMLAAVGVDEDDVIADYARTESLLPEWRNRAVLERLRSVHPEAVHLEELATRSPASAMAGVLASVRATHGGSAAYLRNHGLGDDELAQLRSALIDAG